MSSPGDSSFGAFLSCLAKVGKILVGVQSLHSSTDLLRYAASSTLSKAPAVADFLLTQVFATLE